jgi:hypothetical protein
MAEALGLAANIIAVIQISEQVVSACYHYYRTVKDAKKDIIAIINVVNGLKSMLDSLGVLIVENDDPNDLPPSCLTCLDEPLRICESTLKELGISLGVKFDANSAR